MVPDIDPSESGSSNKYRRSQSLADPASHKAHSRKSFSIDDIQSLPPTPPLSPHSSRRRLIDKYDMNDETMSLINRNLNSTASRQYYDPFRSVSDLMRPDLYAPRRQPFMDTQSNARVSMQLQQHEIFT